MTVSAEGRGRRRRLRRRTRRPAGAMTIVEHLSELRTRLIYALLAFAAVSVVAFTLFEPLLDLLTRPLCQIDPERLGPQGCRLIYTGALGGFQARLKVTALAGIVGASPIWLYQLWAFVSPGLTLREKRYAGPFIVTSVLLFAVGVTFAYSTLPTALDFLVRIAGRDLVPFFRAEEYIGFVGLVFIAFGLTFELPVVLFFLGLAGVVTVDALRGARRGAIVGIVALAAVVTPSQDPYTMLGMAVPLYLLYEATILLLALVLRRRRAKGSPTAS